MKDKIKSSVGVGVMGLNAAAIVFLFTHFVPRVEYDKLHAQHDRHVDKYEILAERVVVQEATLNVYRAMLGDDFD